MTVDSSNMSMVMSNARKIRFSIWLYCCISILVLFMMLKITTNSVLTLVWRSIQGKSFPLFTPKNGHCILYVVFIVVFQLLLILLHCWVKDTLLWCIKAMLQCSNYHMFRNNRDQWKLSCLCLLKTFLRKNGKA